MIKLIISFYIIIFIFSCKEFQNQKISSTINDKVKKIEKIIEKKEEDENYKNQNKKNYNKLFYYIGDPYFIEGVEYLPQEDYNYSDIGLATFYGKELHNIKTVNNDYNKVTELLGRHKTLPVPSMVKITNLDNGLSINIKIIDRHNDNASLVQVSRKVAQLLGFYKEKIATVRVDILPDASKQWKSVAKSLSEDTFNETVTSAPTDVVSISDIDNIETSENTNKNYMNINEPVEVLYEEVNQFDLFLRVYNFESLNSIQNAIQGVKSEILYTSEKNGSTYDVIIGPIDKEEVNNLVSYFISKGYKDSKIILD